MAYYSCCCLVGVNEPQWRVFTVKATDTIAAKRAAVARFNEDELYVEKCHVSTSSGTQYSAAYLASCLLRNEHGTDVLDRLWTTSAGICRECRGITSPIEPDQREGYCEHCGSNRVVAGQELALETMA